MSATTIHKSDAAYKEWLVKNMPEPFAKDLPAEDLEMIAHTLVYNEQLEEYMHLNLKTRALVLSLNHEDADETILKHYGSRGVKEYRTYVSKPWFPGYQKELRVTTLGFTSAATDDAAFAMPENVAPTLIKEALANDSVAYRFFEEGSGRTQLCFAWRNVQKRYFVYMIACACRRHQLRITSVRFAYLNPLSKDCVLLGAIGLENEAVLQDYRRLKHFTREFELLKAFRGNDALAPLVNSGTITGNQGNLLRSIASLLGQLLAEVNASLYTEENIIEAFAFHPELTIELLALFEARFHPRRHVDAVRFQAMRAELEAKLASLDTGLKKHDDRRRMVFQQAINVTAHVLKTNAYEATKLGLAFRLDPAYLDCVPGFDRSVKYPELPFGIFFVKGWNYFGFQIRFRDLARGGMRTVVSWDTEREQYERTNMFGECYNLAYTQQKKNKDIPEGGSKSILFLRANEELAPEVELARRELADSGMAPEKVDEAIAKYRREQELEYMYYNQRCFLHTLLTMITWDFERNYLKYGSSIVDYLGVPEYLYLGPDENFHDSMIAWLAKESVRLGYYAGGAFISGKEETGINHKEYGVTSWGAMQYLSQGLKFLHMDGQFTVKITGGPDGDVAGNFMLLLGKHFADRAKVVIITDGSGTCYDPQGLDLGVLAEMFHKVQMIHDYPRDKMHPGSWFLCMRRTRQTSPLTKECLCLRCGADGKVVEDWVTNSSANTTYATNAHTHYTDVFLPCGGRPRALNGQNVATFIGADGKPNSRLIVEGANLYLTQDARDYLEDRGVMLFKDSSANKCGVVSSSYEILAGLSMTDEQFVKVKAELARNILVRLEKIANDEARCMIDYWVAHEGKIHMSKISELVSQRINKFTDDLAAHLKTVDLNAAENKALLDVFIKYVPECIRRDHPEQCLARVPDMHKKAVIATRIACHLVYSKGLDYEPTVIDILPLLIRQ
eukprot:m51a1_g544 putative NADP-glutamate dehydrogenase (957) ;mRNA; f:427026-430634